MRLLVIKSGSTGNAYALDSGNEVLLIEAGVRLSDTLLGIDFKGDKVVGCIVSHRHKDHAAYAEEYARHGFKVFANEDVVNHLSLDYGTYHLTEDEVSVRTGGFTLTPLKLYHDVPIQGFLIYHKDMGTLLFATDTYKLGYKIGNINHFLIEANYDDGILKCNVQDGKIDRKQANRLMLSHLSIDNTIGALEKCQASNAQNIILCHLSERNSDEELFKNRVQGIFGVPTYVATPGIEVNLSRI